MKAPTEIRHELNQVSRSNFIEKIIFFKNKYQKGIKEILIDINLRKQFFEEPIIRDYLSRDASQISFVDDHPDLVNAENKQGRNNTDYYELKIYRYMQEVIPFRGYATSSLFYNKGTPPIKSFRNFFLNLNKNCSEYLYIHYPIDIYDIKQFLDGYSSSFVLNAGV